MISAIRRSFGKKMTQVILWVTLISLAGVSSIVSLFRRFSGLPETTLAEVGGYEITALDFRRKAAAEEQRLAYYRKQFGPYASYFLQSLGLSDNPYENALQSLVQEKLLLSAADKLSLRLAHDFVMKKLENPGFALQALPDLVPPFIYDSLGGLDTKLLVKYLQRQGMSISQFEQAIEDALRRMIVAELLPTAIYVPQKAVEQRFIKDYVGRTYEVLEVPLSNYLKKAKQENLTLQEIRSFFESQNALNKRYWVPEKRDAKVWTFEPNNFGLTLSLEELQDGYSRYKERFADKPAQIVVRKITTSDESKANALAQEFAQYPLRFTEQSGKQTEIISETSKHDPLIKQAAFALSQDGATSPALKTEQGFVILGRVSKEEAIYKPFEKVKAEVEKLVLHDKFAANFVRTAQASLSNVADFVAAKKGSMDTRSRITKVDDALGQAIFSLPMGGATALLQKDKGIIVEVTHVYPAQSPEFESVEKQVREDLYQERARELMKADLATLERLAKEKPMKELASEYKGSYATYSLKNKQDKQWEKLSTLQLPIRRMMGMTRVGSCIKEQEEEKGYVIRVSKLDSVDMASFKAEAAQAQKELFDEETSYLGAAFIASLQKNVTINMNNSLISATINRPR